MKKLLVMFTGVLLLLFQSTMTLAQIGEEPDDGGGGQPLKNKTQIEDVKGSTMPESVRDSGKATTRMSSPAMQRGVDSKMAAPTMQSGSQNSTRIPTTQQRYSGGSRPKVQPGVSGSSPVPPNEPAPPPPPK